MEGLREEEIERGRLREGERGGGTSKWRFDRGPSEGRHAGVALLSKTFFENHMQRKLLLIKLIIRATDLI